jgi:2-desacetyl-2-hydroxyethyl bacteriochlorophyllide A dehydrogenase
MKRTTIYFTGPGKIEGREDALRAAGDGEVLVETELSAISAGTEMLIYRGEFPRGLEDARDAVSSQLAYPLAYGYAAVGTVVEIGKSVGLEWNGRRVFAFQPHSSHFIATTHDVLPVPPGLESEDAVFLPNMETAVNLVQDAAPVLGERCLVLGQGVVGLLTAAILREFPLETLVSADAYEWRRKASAGIGVTAALDPAAGDFREAARARSGQAQNGYDLTVELTGNPAALDDAIDLTTFSGRIIVGSWFGTKSAPIDLGGRFHRSRIRLVASQVSTISPELSGRWSKARRFEVAWSQLARIHPAKWITHRYPLERASEAYRMLAKDPSGAIQVVFTYS